MTVLLCLSQKSSFLSNWASFLSMCLAHLKVNWFNGSVRCTEKNLLSKEISSIRVCTAVFELEFILSGQLPLHVFGTFEGKMWLYY